MSSLVVVTVFIKQQEYNNKLSAQRRQQASNCKQISFISSPDLYDKK